MQPSVRARSIAGGLAPALFLVVLVVLTLAEQDFLRRVGWSAVHRTPVEWPSLLALGHSGWVLITTFVIGGICGVALASAMWSVAVVFLLGWTSRPWRVKFRSLRTLRPPHRLNTYKKPRRAGLLQSPLTDSNR